MDKVAQRASVLYAPLKISADPISPFDMNFQGIVLASTSSNNPEELRKFLTPRALIKRVLYSRRLTDQQVREINPDENILLVCEDAFELDRVRPLLSKSADLIHLGDPEEAVGLAQQGWRSITLIQTGAERFCGRIS